MRAYIEIFGAVVVSRYELHDWELRSIGEFTRGNVARWLDGHTSPDWVGILPVEDFHAVFGDIDIPWATKKGFDCYRRVMEIS